MIKAVIFDFGNVISHVQTGECYKLMEQVSSVKAEIFSSSFSKFRDAFDLGDINGAKLYSLILSDNGYPELSTDTELCTKLARYDMDSWSNINKEANDWALELKKSGYKLGVLSNMPYEFLDTYENDIGVFTEADAAVFSCRVKLIKPDPRIYRIVLERLGIAPHEAVFFDDIPINIEAAKNEGLNAILWKNIEQSRLEFETILNTKK